MLVLVLVLVLVLGGARIRARLRLLSIGALVQDTAFLGGAAALEPDRARVAADTAGDLVALCASAGSAAGRGVIGAGRGRGEVGDVLGDRMAGADVGDADVRRFAGFAEGVVAGIEVLALLEAGVRNVGQVQK